MAFSRLETKSVSEAIDVLFSGALPSLPVVTKEDVRRMCRESLGYDVDRGKRHVVGSMDHVRPIVTWNAERALRTLYSGQKFLTYQVDTTPQFSFAVLAVVVGDAQGSPGYAFGARLWRTTDQIFVQGWEGFETTPRPAAQEAPAVPVVPAQRIEAPRRVRQKCSACNWVNETSAVRCRNCGVLLPGASHEEVPASPPTGSVPVQDNPSDAERGADISGRPSAQEAATGGSKKAKGIVVAVAAVVLFAVVTGLVVRSGECRRVTVFQVSADNLGFSGWSSMRTNPATGQLEMIPLAEVQGIDIVVGSDVTLAGKQYASGDRLTAQNGTLVHQAWFERLLNDMRCARE